jgi:hypothetical protein
MIAKEIQEMRDALQAFQTAIEAGEVAGLKNGPTRSHQGPETVEWLATGQRRRPG